MKEKKNMCMTTVYHYNECSHVSLNKINQPTNHWVHEYTSTHTSERRQAHKHTQKKTNSTWMYSRVALLQTTTHQFKRLGSFVHSNGLHLLQREGGGTREWFMRAGVPARRVRRSLSKRQQRQPCCQAFLKLFLRQRLSSTGPQRNTGSDDRLIATVADKHYLKYVLLLQWGYLLFYR